MRIPISSLWKLMATWFLLRRGYLVPSFCQASQCLLLLQTGAASKLFWHISFGTFFSFIIFYLHIFLGMHLLIGRMSWQLIFQISSILRMVVVLGRQIYCSSPRFIWSTDFICAGVTSTIQIQIYNNNISIYTLIQKFILILSVKIIEYKI